MTEATALRRVPGLDTLRIVLALWVVLWHIGLPIVPFVEHTPALRALSHSLFPGAAAVIVFFLISGFCIHYPHRGDRRIALVPFYARRHIRILIPLLAAIALGWLTTTSARVLLVGVLWSLVCEEIYYTIYPILFWLWKRVGHVRLLAISFVVAYVVIALAYHRTPTANPLYAAGGVKLTWLVGLPCWLLGCLLAEKVGTPVAPVSSLRIWAVRLGAWVLGSTSVVLHLHSSISYPVSLNLFALYAAWWLWLEIAHAERRSKPAFLERFGAMSYSLYLIHIQINYLWPAQTQHPILGWLIRLTSILAAAAVFYVLVERPSHHLARYVYRVVRDRADRLREARPTSGALPRLSEGG